MKRIILRNCFLQVIVGHLERAVEVIASKHRLEWAAKEAERQRVEEEERRRAYEEEMRRLAEEEERRLAEEERRRSALAEEERRRSAEEERRRIAEEERMKIQAEKHRLANADLLEKEQRRAAEALASEFPMTSAGQVAECDKNAGGQSASSSNIVSQEKKNAGKPLWWNEECERARERYRVAHNAFKLRPNKTTSDKYHEARKAVDEAEQKAMKEHIESRSGGEMGETSPGPDQKEGARWWNKECQEAKQKLLVAEKRMKKDGYVSKERQIEFAMMRKAFNKVRRRAKAELERKERGGLSAGEKKRITKLHFNLDQELKKGAANAEGINRARLSLNKSIEYYESKYGTHIYFDSTGAMKEVTERNPSLYDPPESIPQDRDTSKTLDDVLRREAEEAPWWNEECRKADEAFRKAREVPDSDETDSKFIRGLWRNLIEAKRKALEDYVAKNDVKGKEKERLLLFFHVNKEEARKRLDCYKALSEAGTSSATLPRQSNRGGTVLKQCVPKKSYNQWHEQWEKQKMKVRELEMSISAKTTAGARKEDVAEHILKELDFEKGVLEEVVRCAREAGYKLRPKWLPIDLFEALVEFEDVLKGPEDERERYSPRFQRFAAKVKKAKSRYVLEHGLSGVDEQMVNMEAREIVSRYDKLIKKCCVGIKRKMKRVNFLEQDDVVGGEKDICPPGTVFPVTNLFEGLESCEEVELDTNYGHASKSTAELIEDERKVGGIVDYLEMSPWVVIDDDSLSLSSFSSVEILEPEGEDDIFPPGEELSSDCRESKDNEMASEFTGRSPKSVLEGADRGTSLMATKPSLLASSASSVAVTRRSPEEQAAYVVDKLHDFTALVKILHSAGINTDGLTNSQILHRVRKYHRDLHLQKLNAPAPTCKSRAPSSSKLDSGKGKIKRNSDPSPKFLIRNTENREENIRPPGEEEPYDAVMKRSPEEQAAYQADKLQKAREILHSAGINTDGLTNSQIFHRVRKYHKDQKIKDQKAAYQADKLKKAMEILHSAGINTDGLTKSQIFTRVRKYHKNRKSQKLYAAALDYFREGRVERKSASSPQIVLSVWPSPREADIREEENICPPGEEEQCDERNGIEGLVDADLEDISDGSEDGEGAASKRQIQKGGFSDWSSSDDDSLSLSSFSSVEILEVEGGEDFFPGEEPSSDCRGSGRASAFTGSSPESSLEGADRGTSVMATKPSLSASSASSVAVTGRSPEEQAAYLADKLQDALKILHSAGINTDGLTNSQIFHCVRKYHKDQRKRPPGGKKHRNQEYKRRKMEKKKEKKKLQKAQDRRSQIQGESSELHDEEGLCPPGEEPTSRPQGISTIVGVELDQDVSQTRDWL